MAGLNEARPSAVTLPSVTDPTTEKIPSVWAFAAIGITAGFLAGMLGVGGGIVLVPLMLAVGVAQHRAHATSLLAILVIASAGMIRFAFSGEVAWLLGLVVAAGAIAGSTVGSRVMGRMSPRVLRAVFVVMLVVAGTRMVIGGEVGAGGGMDDATAWVIALLIGLVSGFTAGVAGVGGGVIIVPALVFLLGIEQHTAEGTSLLVIIFTALAASRVNLAEGRVNIRDGLVMGFAGVVSTLIGASLALGLDGQLLTQIFGVFSLVVAARMAWSIRPRSPRPA